MKIYPGDILKIENKYILILIGGEFKGFYYVVCDPNGDIDAHHGPCHTFDTPAKLNAQRTGRVDMLRKSCEHAGVEYIWHILNPQVYSMVHYRINASLSLLDSRYKLFNASADDKLKKLFDKLEDGNQHTKCGHMVQLYCDFLKLQLEAGE